MGWQQPNHVFKALLEPLSLNWSQGQFAVMKWGLSFQEKGALGNPISPTESGESWGRRSASSIQGQRFQSSTGRSFLQTWPKMEWPASDRSPPSLEKPRTLLQQEVQIMDNAMVKTLAWRPLWSVMADIVCQSAFNLSLRWTFGKLDLAFWLCYHQDCDR